MFTEVVVMDYSVLYHIMLDASERAIEAIENGDYSAAKAILIAAELRAEELFVDAE